MDDNIYNMTNRELLHYEYNNRSSDLASELADRLEEVMKKLGAMVQEHEDFTDNTAIKVPNEDRYYHINEIKKLLE